jgi:hypothetical protein
MIFIAALTTGVAVALVAGAPARVSHAWQDFKRPTATALERDVGGRFGSTSGNGRYAYWKLAADQTGAHPIGGFGPGTFQFVWLSRGPYYSYVENAHSLYFETLLEDGVVGVAILIAFIVFLLAAAVRAAVTARHQARDLGAAAAAGCTAVAVSAGVDWVWQIPVIPICFILLGAAALAPRRWTPAPTRDLPGADNQSPVPATGRLSRGLRRSLGSAALAALAVGALLITVIPLQATNDLRRSQRAAAANDLQSALRFAHSAARLQPDAATPQIQTALVDELRHDIGSGVAAARRATADEPMNWSAWLVRFRLEAENGNPGVALQALDRARALNPRSPLFRNS